MYLHFYFYTDQFFQIPKLLSGVIRKHGLRQYISAGVFSWEFLRIVHTLKVIAITIIFFLFLQTFGGETLSYAKWIIPIAVAMSCYSGLNSSIIAASRYEI